MKLLDLLRRMFGKDYLNSVIGTRTNISKPIKLDKNSPFKEYSDSAFDDPKVLAYIEEKLMEYGPYVLSNKNMAEVQKFIKNAERYIQARNKQAGVTEGMKSAKDPKPEAEVFDIGTKKKVGKEGIETLKSEIGLPEGVEPGSDMAKIIQDRAEINQGLKGLESKLKDFAKATDNVDESPESFVEKTLRDFSDMQAKQYSIQQEGQRRAAMRKILLMDDRLDLPEDIRKRLANMDDLKGDTEVDPLNIFDRFYSRNNKQLEALDEAIEGANSPKEAAEKFFKMGEQFDLRPAIQKEDKINFGKVESKQLEGVNLKGGESFSELEYIKKFKKHPRDTISLPRRPDDYDDLPIDEQRGLDIEEEEIYKNAVEEAIDDDIPDMAEGGRIGFASGTGLKALLAMMGKGAKTADKVEQPASSKLKKMFDDFNKRNRQLTDEDIQDYELELGDAETWYESGMTVADAEKLVADRKAYEAQMLVDYKAGRLDPKPGEPGRREYLEKKLQEAEMSGDSRLIDPDELDELTDIEFRERTMNAEGGLNYLMGL